MKHTLYSTELFEKLLNTKNSFKKGVIIETGAGCPLYNILCTQPNTASKLVLYSESPTDYEYTKVKYQLKDDGRAVSPQTVQNMVVIQNLTNPTIEWIFTNSIQIGNDYETQTHGWIGYKYKDKTTLYHFTINNFKKYTRIELLDLIQQICLDVFLSQNNGSINNGYIDEVVDATLGENYIADSHYEYKTLLNNLIESKLLKENSDDTFICNYGSKFKRFNDFLRQYKCLNKELVIFKGSFNPLHPTHYDMYKTILDQGKYCIMMISINNRELNKKTDIDNLIKRVNILKALYIPFIINTRGYYEDCVYQFENHQECKDVKYSFLLGDDTLKRLIDDNNGTKKDWSKIPFITVQRSWNKIINKNYTIEYLDMDKTGVSSTHIRANMNDNSVLLEVYKNHPDLLHTITTYYIQ